MTFVVRHNKALLDEFFDESIHIPDCEIKTRSYIIGIFSEMSADRVLSDQSMTLALIRAQEKMSFKDFKELGDWLFFAKSLFPKSLQGASSSYYDGIARTSYYKCFLLLNRKWLLYEELADCFEEYTQIINASLESNGFLQFKLNQSDLLRQ